MYIDWLTIFLICFIMAFIAEIVVRYRVRKQMNEIDKVLGEELVNFLDDEYKTLMVKSLKELVSSGILKYDVEKHVLIGFDNKELILGLEEKKDK